MQRCSGDRGDADAILPQSPRWRAGLAVLAPRLSATVGVASTAPDTPASTAPTKPLHRMSAGRGPMDARMVAETTCGASVHRGCALKSNHGTGGKRPRAPTSRSGKPAGRPEAWSQPALTGADLATPPSWADVAALRRRGCCASALPSSFRARSSAPLEEARRSRSRGRSPAHSLGVVPAGPGRS